jgi:GNAT superfamily N-acetyltransferase
MASGRIDPRVTYENQSLNMVCDDCTDIPRHVLPAGYRFRPYRAGDDSVWTALHQAAEPFFDIATSLFDGQYGAQRAALPDRMWFVETEAAEPVASISAWWEHEPPTPDDRGRIHWVVVHPEHQRRGLSKAMMTVAMDRLALSHPAAMLGTSTGRPWAIKVYLDFGFHPDPAQVDAPDVQHGWRNVQSIIAHPALANWSQSPKIDR